jgi:hypothetical protein
MPRKRENRLRYRKIFDLGNGQSFQLTCSSKKGHFTAVSYDVMREMPLVVGPIELAPDTWLEIAEICTKIAGLIGERDYSPHRARVDPELY